MASTPNPQRPQLRSKRNFLLFCAALTALYPLFRFLGFSVPRKPRIIEITKVLIPGGFFLGPDFILFDDGEVAWAISRHCTHLGCTVNFHEKDKIIECPCHQSRFSIDGKVIHGPAKKDLPRYKVERLEKDTGYLITI